MTSGVRAGLSSPWAGSSPRNAVKGLSVQQRHLDAWQRLPRLVVQPDAYVTAAACFQVPLKMNALLGVEAHAVLAGDPGDAGFVRGMRLDPGEGIPEQP